ncbi:MAG TPA: hypothetical protein ENJ32_00355, partial [Crenotrichaceae bacterium]|nr:hypothetical protein [Crenotrichaceae bacterium]
MRLRDYHHQLAVLFFLVIFGIGLFVRLDQFLLQILIDDEWHAVHQLLHSTPANIATSFGHADYSIPLTLLYWFEAEQFGLSELLMRWPMMLAGILTLIVFPLYVFRQFSQHEAILFGSVIALSPLLVIYSRTARPYAITLFLVYLSVWAFYRFYDNADTEKPGQRLRYALLYCVSAAMAVWLHLIAGFFVVAPFILEASRLIIKPTVSVKRNLLALLSIGLPALALIWLLILPPLVNSLHALTVKAGSDLPSIDSLTGALYLWIGTRSGMLVIACCFLGLIGFPRVIKQSVISINILLGFVLTVLLILVSQPAWVQHPLTLARYLLPILPLLLLSIACGLYT